MRVNELSETGRAWYQHYLSLFDSGRFEALLALASDDCSLQIGNHVPVYGRDAIAPVLQRIHGRYARIEREVLNVYGSDMRFASEMLWHYSTPDGARITVPAAHFVDRREDGLIESVRIYVDTSPLPD